MFRVGVEHKEQNLPILASEARSENFGTMSADDETPTKTSEASDGSSGTTHLVVLVHGIMGNRDELGYVKEALERESQEVFQSTSDRLLVHASSTNEQKTLDGVEAGGQRLSEEINEYVKGVLETDSKAGTTTGLYTLSIIANSLGGLYARYCLSSLQWTDNLLPLLFVTTATPHLGVQSMTYWKIPKSLEPVGAWYMRQSGKDLFRYTNVVQELCMDPTHLKPLGRFRKRIAYANTFSTDAAVPTATAAFLSETTSTHTVTSVAVEDTQYPTIRVETPSTPHEGPTNTESEPEAQTEASLNAYSLSLDSLGWTKVFLDVRSHIPALWKRGEPRKDLGMYQVGETRSSSELKQQLSKSDRNTLPFSHSFMVASTKNTMYKWFYGGGRPLVDKIAKELVQEIAK